MPDTQSYHHRGDAAVARLDLVAMAPPAAPATTTTTACDEEEDEDGFTFTFSVPVLQVTDCADAWIGPVYPVFGRPRWSQPQPKEQQQQDDDEEEPAPAATGTDTVRVQLGRLLLEDRWCDCAPSSASGHQQQQQPVDDAAAELDGVPAETYCLWSPAPEVSPALAPAGSSSGQASPARCRKSRPTSSPVVLRWRRQRRVAVERSLYSDDGKDKFVSFLGTNSDRIAGDQGHGWKNRGSGTGKSSSATTSFLPCKQALVGLVTSAVTFRRSCYPF